MPLLAPFHGVRLSVAANGTHRSAETRVPDHADDRALDDAAVRALGSRVPRLEFRPQFNGPACGTTTGAVTGPGAMRATATEPPASRPSPLTRVAVRGYARWLDRAHIAPTGARRLTRQAAVDEVEASQPRRPRHGEGTPS